MKKFTATWPKKFVVLSTVTSLLTTAALANGQVETQAPRPVGTASEGTKITNLNEEQMNSIDGVEKIYAESVQPAVEEYIDKKQSAIQSILDREFDKARIDIPIDIPSISMGALNISVRGNRRVSQTKEGEQQRIDDLIVNVRLGDGVFAQVGFKVSSAKYFTNADLEKYNEDKVKAGASEADKAKSLKWYALKSKPIKSIPRTAQKVKESLNVRESLSVEINGSFGLEKNESNRDGRTKTKLGVSITRGASFVIDLSRTSENHVIIRLMGLKNRGEFLASLSGGFSLLSTSFNPLADAASIGLKIELGITDRILNRFPVESLIVSYKIDVLQQKGIEALDHVLKGVGKFDFIPLFVVGVEAEELSKELMNKLGKLEIIAETDLISKNPNPAVTRLIRAKMMTQNHKGAAELKGTTFSSAKYTRGGSKTYIRYFDPATKQVKPYIIFNEHYSDESKIRFGNSELKNRGTERLNFDFLASADMNMNVTQPIGLITSIEGKQSRFEDGDTSSFRSSVMKMIPQFTRDSANIVTSLPSGKHHSVFYKVETIINQEGLAAIGKIPQPNIDQAIIDYVNANGLYDAMTTGAVSGGSKHSPKALHEVSGPLAKGLSQLSTGKTTDSFELNYLELGKYEEVVRSIAPNLFPKLLPNDANSLSMVSVNLEFDSSTAKIRRKIPAKKGEKDVRTSEVDPIEVYRIVNRLRAILTERGFEERLRDDFEENNILVQK